VAVLNASQADASQITVRSVTLLPSSDGKTGGSTPSGGGGYTVGSNPNEQFKFTIPTLGNVGSIQFLWCQTASLTSCTSAGVNAPTGMDATAATYGSESGVTGFSIRGASTTANNIVITRTAASVPANTVATIQLNNIKNPSTLGVFYIRISTFVAIDGTGTAVDTGTVAAATANAVQLSGIMPESLQFCVGMTVTADCATVTTGVISFGALFSTTVPTYATSQMAAATNASGGYVITVTGPPLTSGTGGSPPTIPLIGSTAKLPTTGTSEFGLNLALDTVATPVGSGSPASAALTAASNGTTLKGNVSAGYATGGNLAAALYRFASGDTVADSTNGGAGPTNGQVYTATYMVDVSPIQTAGTYTTNVTYVCTPTF